jgi:hypothetical protein
MDGTDAAKETFLSAAVPSKLLLMPVTLSLVMPLPTPPSMAAMVLHFRPAVDHYRAESAGRQSRRRKSWASLPRCRTSFSASSRRVRPLRTT